ncbi:MAG: alpha/beta hydrolase [Pseudomonadota bacterium]
MLQRTLVLMVLLALAAWPARAQDCPVSPAILDEFAMTGDEPIRFKVIGREAMVWGTITDAFPCKLRRLLSQHPDLETLVLRKMPGSVAETRNLEAGRFLRASGLNTRLKNDSDIASGATTLFLAGVEREGAREARIGVHSWAYGDATTARDYRADSAVHDGYLSFFEALGRSPDFYWFTIKAAGADEMHYMRPAELKRFEFFTD